MSLQGDVETPSDVPEALLDSHAALETSVGSMQALAIANPDLYLNLGDMIQGTKTPEEVAEATQAQFAELASAMGADGFRHPLAGCRVIRHPACSVQLREEHFMSLTTTVAVVTGRSGSHSTADIPVGRPAITPCGVSLPALIVLVVFFFLPTVFNFIYAFTNWSSFHAEIGLVGWENFRALFANGSLLNSLRITLVYAVLVAVFQNLFGLLLALLLERDTHINRAVRVAFFIPVIMSALAVGYVFQAMLKPDGAVNAILSAVTGQNVEIPWLGDTTWTIVVVSIVHALEVGRAVDADLSRWSQDHRR